MKKQLRFWLPVVIFVSVLVIGGGLRAYSLKNWSKIKTDGVAKLYPNGLGQDGISAINEPKFINVSEADEFLADEVKGISVVMNGQARFYSFQILNWHSAVNDIFSDRPLLISYSTLCGGAVVYDRILGDGETHVFGDAGQVIDNCTVLYDDKTGSLWNQATGVAVAGQYSGQSLKRYQSEVMSWAEWKKAYPSGQVLSSDTGFARNYRVHPYGGYESNDSLFFPVSIELGGLLAKKELVYDVILDNGQHIGLTPKFVAFLSDLTVNDRYAAFLDGAKVHLFERTVKGQVLTFKKEGNVITDAETGSTWSYAGVATSGPLRGQSLVELPATGQYYAFAYLAHFKDSLMPGREVFVESLKSKPADEQAGETLNVGE